jgi:hypothetical protein
MWIPFIQLLLLLLLLPLLPLLPLLLLHLVFMSGAIWERHHEELSSYTQKIEFWGGKTVL